jgi:hypothetical protein
MTMRFSSIRHALRQYKWGHVRIRTTPPPNTHTHTGGCHGPPQPPKYLRGGREAADDGLHGSHKETGGEALQRCGERLTRVHLYVYVCVEGGGGSYGWWDPILRSDDGVMNDTHASCRGTFHHNTATGTTTEHHT